MIGQQILENFNHEVILADGGQAALELLQKPKTASFDLIFMDCQMPELDGFDTTKLIRKLGVKVPIIALTANTSAEDKERSLSAGMNVFMSKPFKPADIQQIVERWQTNLDRSK